MNKEHFSLVYFLSRPLFLGIAFSLLFNQSGSDAIIACLLGTLLGIGLIWFINKMNFSKDNFKIIQLIIYIYLLVLSIMVLEAFISSFFLTTTPKLLIIAPSIILCLYASFKKMKTIKRTTFLLFFLSITIFSIAALSLGNFFTISNITPLFTHKTTNILKSAVVFASLSACPNILLKEENIKLSKHIGYYIFSCIIHTLVCTIILGSLTPNVAQIYSFPEYMVLKRIKIFTFIENIENILSSIWYIDIFVFITLLSKRIYNIIKSKLLFFPIVIAIVIFTTYFIVDDYYRVIFLYHYTPYILLGLITLLGTSALKKS
ncbi:MAG: GerAB/ArcD/ProY family transporter [Bacilli bacterium]|nr:GerAB/ArcD/ProY family transporter [Bacilli bacterium]